MDSELFVCSEPSQQFFMNSEIPLQGYNLSVPPMSAPSYPYYNMKAVSHINEDIQQQLQSSSLTALTSTEDIGPTISTNLPVSSSNHQMNSTLKWLETNFKFRLHVSISRSTIYDLYQKFCKQSQFVPVCKATFGKVIRVKFPKVKSKRLGARGQSKYHYYNITFKDEQKRCSMIINKPRQDLTINQTIVTKHNLNQKLSVSNCGYITNSYMPVSLPNFSYSTQITEPNFAPSNVRPDYTAETENDSTLQHHNLIELNLAYPADNRATQQRDQLVSAKFYRLSIFSSRHPSLENYSQLNLNENDYHAIIQSMLSFMRIPNVQPLNDPRYVFINLYKIHCQCLIDSALSQNYSQMRHYIMHFWQQLPRHIMVYVDVMHCLDAHLYSLLENIYLSSFDSPLHNLRRLNSVAYLIPVWLRKTFEYVSNEEQCWQLKYQEQQHQNMVLELDKVDKIGQIKINEAVKWSFRIKFKVDFIISSRKINILKFPSVLQNLLNIVDEVYENHHYNYDIPSSNACQYWINADVNNNCHGPLHRFHHKSKLRNALLKQFRISLYNLFDVTNRTNNKLESNQIESVSVSLLTICKALVDELDRMVRSIAEQIVGEQRAEQQIFYWQNDNNLRNESILGYSNADICMCFASLFNDIIRWLSLEQPLLIQDNDFCDEFVIDEEDENKFINDDEDDEQNCDHLCKHFSLFKDSNVSGENFAQWQESLNQESIQTRGKTKICFESDLNHQQQYHEQEMKSQLYLLLMLIQNYLMEICQTDFRKLKYKQSIDLDLQ